MAPGAQSPATPGHSSHATKMLLRLCSVMMVGKMSETTYVPNDEGDHGPSSHLKEYVPKNASLFLPAHIYTDVKRNVAYNNK